ncbi:hypothetical protein [Neosynechococcus sphagnicola]|nr:hypothetical protein [Neosynechococcus sphagnicola]
MLLIDQIHVLPQVYGRIVIPDRVQDELAGCNGLRPVSEIIARGE